MTEDTNKRASLFFQDVELGEVLEEEADFPNLSGTFCPSLTTVDSPLRRRLQSFIECCLAADRLMQEGKEEEWETFAAENEPQFMDLIETDDWYLKYGDRVMPILVPRFCQDNGIVWRWNVSARNEGPPIGA